MRNILIGFVVGVAAAIGFDHIAKPLNTPETRYDPLDRYGNAIDGFVDTNAAFVATPGVWHHLQSNTIYRYEPVLPLQDSTDFETCFTFEGIESDVWPNALGLRVFLIPEDRETLKAALDDHSDVNIFTIENGIEITRFHTLREDNPQAAYAAKIKNKPDEADLVFMARENSLQRLMHFAASLTPGRLPPACEANDDLNTIKHWDLLKKRFWPDLE